MFRIFEIIGSSIKMALEEFRSNKLRTFLSLFGITIGIFCIIGVLATVNSLERNVQNDIKSLGTNSVYIDKWEYSGGENYPWWRMIKRPAMKYTEMEMLQKKITTADAMAFKIDTRGNVEFEDNVVNSINYLGISEQFPEIQKVEVGEGRFLQQSDYDFAANSLVVGHTIAEQLFGRAELAVGKKVEIKGKVGNIVGVIKKQGKNMIDMWEFDETIIMPYGFLKSMIREEYGNPVIIVKGKEDVPIAELKDDLTAAMRSIRKLKPTEEDNYSLNDIDTLSQFASDIFSGINLGGWAIAALSLFVGMFGVANIMFVTVRERTPQIGLKKALGARRSTILLEFLMESAFLCILGGAIGLLLVFILTTVITLLLDFPVFISMGIMSLAISICIVIGILAGIIPASIAARMDPVVAIRSK
jgi:putative ABC transport system permease protein